MAFFDRCRLCGTDTLNIVRNAIFEGEGLVKKYDLKIAECLTLQVIHHPLSQPLYYSSYQLPPGPGWPSQTVIVTRASPFPHFHEWQDCGLRETPDHAGGIILAPLHDGGIILTK
jgi:hypothetical protein